MNPYIEWETSLSLRRTRSLGVDRVKKNATERQRQVRGAHQDEFSGTGVGSGVSRVVK